MNNTEQLEKEIRDIKNSLSYKIGRFITFPARKTYDFIDYSFLSKNRLFTHYVEILNTRKFLKKIHPHNKNVIYTFIIGDYDDLKDPIIISEGWDYICFTDNKKLTSNTWKLIYLDDKFFRNYPNCPKKRAMLIMIKYYKFIPKYYDIVISIGAQIILNINLNLLISKYFDINSHDLSLCLHPDRDCIYDEAEACKTFKKDRPDIIDKHIAQYLKEGYPAHNGLFMTGIIIRKNNSKSLKKMCDIWANELINGSRRDQLSLNYAIWKAKFHLSINGINPKEIIGSTPDKFLIIKSHKK
jgi:hypothetical protein